MPYRNRKSSYTNFILIFVFIKIALNTLAISHFGFHRDELLHLVLADHLDWGYKEVPPFVAIIAKLTHLFFGDSLFAARIFPTICSALIIWLTGKITVEFGGKKFAIALACLAMIFSPAFIASGYLFQPVVFDQLWWVLIVWLLLRYINTNAPKYLYFIGVAIGLGILTKYTMLFFAGSIIIALLVTKQRRVVLWNRHMLGTMAVAFIIVLPNFIWQIQHHFPVFTHMAELKEKQLGYITPMAFIGQQLMVNSIALFLWLVGLFFLVFSFKLRKYQFLAIAYILIFLFLLEMNGKSYYLFGAYPMLFAAGGYGFERWIKSNQTLRVAIVLLFTVPNLIFLPMVLPVLPIKPTLSFFDFINKHTHFINFITVWEDHKHHATTQDYADMFGWEEVAQKVAKTYHALTPDQQKNTIIYADNYGLAGALHQFGKQYNLPEPVCLNSSFALWAPNDINAQYIIYVNATRYWDAYEYYKPMAETIQKTDSVTHPLAVEKGSTIMLITHPKPELLERYKKRLEQTKMK
jgi:hypothetical protein